MLCSSIILNFCNPLETIKLSQFNFTSQTKFWFCSHLLLLLFLFLSILLSSNLSVKFISWADISEQLIVGSKIYFRIFFKIPGFEISFWDSAFGTIYSQFVYVLSVFIWICYHKDDDDDDTIYLSFFFIAFAQNYQSLTVKFCSPS